ncbi:MAG: transposase [Bacteroidales bacterium]|nr:transposase [Bacteroidales bacterium]
MSHSQRRKRSPATFRRLTGITPVAFAHLLAELEPRYAAADAKRKSRPGRKRKPGAGRKQTLSLADRLLMLLIDYRTDTTHVFLGFLFGIDDSAVGRNINPLQPLLAGIFRIPERKANLEPEDIQELFFDATERPISRPKRKQKQYYSGKKKRHTVKTQIVVTRRQKSPGSSHPQRVRIAVVSPTFTGKTHDKKVYDQTRIVCPPGVPRTGDTGYVGTSLETPTKRPPRGQLTSQQKAENRRLSRRRIVVEHGIGKMKIWRIAAERYRNPLRRHTLMMKNIAGLHNLMFA